MSPAVGRGASRLAALGWVAAAGGLLAAGLVGSVWWLGGEGRWAAAGGVEWRGPALAGPEPGTQRLMARLGGDEADVYLPVAAVRQQRSTGEPPRPLPAALLLQGANVDKSHYATFAALLAKEGFVVVVPNHWRTFPPLPWLGRRMLLADQRQIPATVAALRQLNATAPPPWQGGIDGEQLVVVGHSMGGLAGLDALANRCRFPLCIGRFARPAALRGGVFVGTDLRGHSHGPVAPIDTDGLPVALITGSRDGASKPEDVTATWRQLRTPRHELLQIQGANHYALTNSSQPVNPPGLPPLHADANAATADQRATLEQLANWSAAFLREAVGPSAAPQQPGGEGAKRKPGP
ncbi:MAG: alpha/beta hydrolase family protein [Cyanobacteriota bacterium]